MRIDFGFRQGAMVAAVVLVLTTAAGAQTFSPPQALSTHGYGNALQLAVDGAGNALATWADEGGWYSVRPARGASSAPTSLYAGGGLWQLRGTAQGSATIVSDTSLYGIWSVDRPPRGSWSAPALIVNAPQIITGPFSSAPQLSFVEDTHGDQAIVFEEYASGGTAIVALRRPAGGTWGPQETIATSAMYGNISLEAAAIGGSGDVVAAFETFHVSCGVHSCSDNDFVLHASREAAGSTTWVDSGALTAPSSEYAIEAVMDPTGRAGLFIEPYYSGTILMTTQIKSNARWRAPSTVFANPAVTLLQAYGSAPAAANAASLGFDAYGTSGLYPTFLEGSLSSQAPFVATIFGPTDPVAPTAGMQYAESPSGAAVMTWADADGSIRAATRMTAGGAWSSPQTIVAGSPCNIGGVVCTAPVAAAIDAAGHAAIGFRRYDPSVTVSTVYVSTD